MTKISFTIENVKNSDNQFILSFIKFIHRIRIFPLDYYEIQSSYVIKKKHYEPLSKTYLSCKMFDALVDSVPSI